MSDLATPRVKVCGITSVPDLELAVSVGADAVGINFFPPSPRFIDIDTAKAIAHACPAFTTLVALFVNPDQETVTNVLAHIPEIAVLQFHGTESPEFCASFGRPYVKSVGVNSAKDIDEGMVKYERASAILLDSFDPVRWGGTGKAFDWEQVPAAHRRPVVLAGGLKPDNVADAIARVRPYSVDVCGGVEASPGVKDPAQMEAFMRSVNSVRLA